MSGPVLRHRYQKRFMVDQRFQQVGLLGQHEIRKYLAGSQMSQVFELMNERINKETIFQRVKDGNE